MNPGRELDVLVAEKVMGWNPGRFRREDSFDELSLSTRLAFLLNESGFLKWGDVLHDDGSLNAVKLLSVRGLGRKSYYELADIYAEGNPAPLMSYCSRYSTSIEAAWEVVEKVGSNFRRLFLEDGQWNAWIDESVHGPTAMESGVSAPHAICLAALSALGDK